MLTKRKWVLIAMAVAVAGEAISAAEIPAPTQAASTRRMAARLEEIAADADIAAHPYANADRVAHLRAELERLQAGGRRRKDPALKAQYALAKELLNAGQSAEAARQFQQLQTAVDNPQVRHVIQAQLGLAHLRLGEQENCILHHSIDSCLLPISGSGVHQNQRGSRAAAKHFSAVLARQPDDLTARWLLNITHMTLGQYPAEVPPAYLVPPKAFTSDYDIGLFRDVAPGLGLDTVGLSGGAIMEDFDGDGYLDIVASSWGRRDPIRYFRNNADGTFADHSQTAGLEGIVGGLNICQADYDNNGSADVLVLRGAWLGERGRHPNSLLSNQGGGRFVDTTEAAGLLTFHPTQTAAWGDYDNDGWVDLYIGNESTGADRHPCELFRNRADGTFVDAAQEAGLAVEGFVKGVVWGDYDNDGQLDLYVSRIAATEPNLLFHNQGADATGPRFADATAAAGVAGPASSFPAWFWDYDNDGWLDLFVAAYAGSAADVAAAHLGLPHRADKPRLYRNDGDGRFTDVTAAARLDRPLLAMGSNFGDLDNDGWLDFYIGTGNPDMSTLVPNLMFRNAAGHNFQDVTTAGGFGHLQKGHGVAFGDIDHDGDQDVFSVIGGAYSGDVYQDVLFANPGHGNHWIKLELEGTRSNRAAIGVRVKVTVDADDGARDIYATVTSGGSFGGSSLRREIGLGRATAVRALEITWPTSGLVQTFDDIAVDQILHIREGDPQPVALSLEPFAMPLAHTRHGGH